MSARSMNSSSSIVSGRRRGAVSAPLLRPALQGAQVGALQRLGEARQDLRLGLLDPPRRVALQPRLLLARRLLEALLRLLAIGGAGLDLTLGVGRELELPGVDRELGAQPR